MESARCLRSLIGQLSFFLFQIWYFQKWIITSIGQSKHMRVTRFNPLWVSGNTKITNRIVRNMEPHRGFTYRQLRQYSPSMTSFSTFFGIPGFGLNYHTQLTSNSMLWSAAGLVQSAGRALNCRAGARGFDSPSWTNTQCLKITGKLSYCLCTANGKTFAWLWWPRKMAVPSPVGDVKT